MIINIEQQSNKLNISYINKKGKIDFYEYNLKETDLFNWSRCLKTNNNSDKKFKSWLNEPIKKQKAKFLTSHRINEILFKNLDQETQDLLFEYNEPTKLFCDIETEILDEFPSPENPLAKIVSISLVNEKNQSIMLATKQLGDENVKNIQRDLNIHFGEFGGDLKTSFRYFTSEENMLEAFFKDYVSKITLLTGWNFVDFDWAYLVKRSEKLGLNLEKLGIQFRRNLEPLHFLVVDYLDLVKNFAQMSADEKESFKLDVFGEKILNVNKIHFTGNLNELYEQDFEKFMLYNLVDSYLVRFIHQETKSLNIFLMLSVLSKTEIYKAYSKVPLIETVLQAKYLEHDKVLFKDENLKSKKRSIDGGYVKTPEKKLKKYLGVFDFSSLYPSIMRQFNISPDTYLGINLPENEIPDNVITTANNTYFKKEPGVLYGILTEIYTRRKETQKKAQDIEKEINYLQKILNKK